MRVHLAVFSASFCIARLWSWLETRAYSFFILDGKVGLVTGASKGIGADIAKGSQRQELRWWSIALRAKRTWTASSRRWRAKEVGPRPARVTHADGWVPI